MSYHLTVDINGDITSTVSQLFSLLASKLTVNSSDDAEILIHHLSETMGSLTEEQYAGVWVRFYKIKVDDRRLAALTAARV